MVDDLLANESARFALATGITAVMVTGLVLMVAVRARRAKWRRLRMRGDARAKMRELKRGRR